MVQLPSLGLDPLIRQARFPSDLYDLSVDPTEQHDLSDSEPEVLARLDALVAEQIAASVPGTHLRCRVPHAPVSLQSDQAFVRGVPLSAGEITVSDDRRELTVEAAASGETRLVVEASQAAEVRVSPADACEMWRVAVPDMEVSLDQDQVENLRSIGYME